VVKEIIQYVRGKLYKAVKRLVLVEILPRQAFFTASPYTMPEAV
jgi:hypothetical protein